MAKGIELLSVISPVYKAEKCVRPLVDRITAVVEKMADVKDYEIVLVEDCGGDGSWEAIKELARANCRLVGVQLSRNFGQHHALTAGLDVCRGDWAVLIDCDLQDEPECIPLLWAEAKKGFWVVNGRREVRDHGLGRRILSRCFHILFEWLSGLSYDGRVANFRIIGRPVIDAYRGMHEASRSVGAQIQWMGFKTSVVNVRQEARFDGGSSYSVRKLLSLAVDTIVSYSNKPLRYVIGIGMSMAFIAIAISVWFLVRALFWGVPVPGWASLIVSLWFIGGVIVANLGVIGIYVGKIYNETKSRPLYIISERIN